MWLVLVLAGITAVLTPIAAEAGGGSSTRSRSPPQWKPTRLGETMIYFALALLVARHPAGGCPRALHPGKALSSALSAVIAVFVLAASVATTVQVFRIGHSGAEATWGDVLTTSPAGAGRTKTASDG